jgi:predicted metal-dependent peptidase
MTKHLSAAVRIQKARTALLLFVETLNAAELAGVLAHEVMHPALQHHTRRGDRDQKRWNMACDYAINPLLLDAGLTLPKDVLIEYRFCGMSAERIYKPDRGAARSGRLKR